MSTSVALLGRILDNAWMQVMGTIQIGLCTGESLDANGNVIVQGEPANGVGGYARVLAPWADIMSIPASRDGSSQSVMLTNFAMITWPQATAAWGTFSHVVIESEFEPGKPIVIPISSGPITVNNEDTAVVNQNTLKVVLSA